MSLNWTVDKIADYENLCYVTRDEGKGLSSITEGLIWNGMRIGMGSITAKNVDEYIRRTLLVEHCAGPILENDVGNHYLTADEIRAHVGLWTNADTVSKTKFRANLERLATDEMNRQAHVRALQVNQS